MSAVEAFEAYYRLFGFRGVLLAAKARSLHQQTEVTIATPGVKHPVHLRLRTSDVGVFRQVLVTREYDAEFRKNPCVIIDAGANIGLTSVFYANKYPDATIISVEPESSNFEILKKNTELYPNITAVHAALWKGNGQISVVDPGQGHYGFRTVESADAARPANRRNPVPSVTVDHLMEVYGLKFVDILKIDIEASEKEVFENSAGWIERVGVVVVELHDNVKAGCSRSVYLATKDFQLEWRKGETVFLAKEEYAGSDLSSPVHSSRAADARNGIAFSARIL